MVYQNDYFFYQETFRDQECVTQFVWLCLIKHLSFYVILNTCFVTSEKCLFMSHKNIYVVTSDKKCGYI